MLLNHEKMREEVNRQEAVEREYVLSISPDEVNAELERIFSPAPVILPRKLIQHVEARREVK